jgi:hypothetical protein
MIDALRTVESILGPIEVVLPHDPPLESDWLRGWRVLAPLRPSKKQKKRKPVCARALDDGQPVLFTRAELI